VTGRRFRGGLLLPLILIAGGVLFLLGNLGVVDAPTWETVARFWPVLLIALGLDLATGRSSVGRAISRLVGSAALLAVGLVAFYLLAPAAWTAREQSIEVGLNDDVSAGSVSISCDRCGLYLSSTESPRVLVEGEITTGWLSSLRRGITRAPGTLDVRLTEAPWSVLPAWSGREAQPPWNLRLTSATPLEVCASAGAVDANLAQLDVGVVDLAASIGPLRVVLSARRDGRYFVAADSVTIVAPDNVGVRIELAALLDSVLPSGFVQTASTISSGNWSDASVRATIVTRPGTGRLSVERLSDSEHPINRPST